MWYIYMQYPCKTHHSALKSSTEVLFHTRVVYFSKSRIEKTLEVFSFCFCWVFSILTLVSWSHLFGLLDGRWICHFIDRGLKSKVHIHCLLDTQLLFQLFVFKPCVFSSLGKLCVLAGVRLLYILSTSDHFKVNNFYRWVVFHFTAFT